MLHSLKLLLPALIPSWRFFDVIAPSPRIEFTLLESARNVPNVWQELRPSPTHISMAGMLRSLFWNPQRNESLFLMSCAERLIEGAVEHSSQEIVARIRADIGANSPFFQFQLALLTRNGAQVEKHIVFVSPVYPVGANP